ncbi:ubiquinol-cytochrome c reductase complex assembly factor 1-like isoform X2 [Zophobas morio]|uniref:ubiquinol-cytochrome c reductase complex assembly factor 1-like isoform X2 n=1 Tax=Zophobas morio TaxID=2755281 RepID=UPI003082DCB9
MKVRFYSICNCENLLIVFEFPDTFHSWWLKTILHVWFSTCRLNLCSAETEALSKELFSLFLDDIEHRLLLLGINSDIFVIRMTKEYYKLSVCLMCSLDKGILGTDCELSSVLWEHVFSSTCTVEALASMVKYIRSELQYLDSQNENDILQGRVYFRLPLPALYL